MIRVSVIVPVHNAAAWLGDCLDALLRQDLPAGSFEIIAVDNRSTDDSAAILKRQPGVRLLSEPAPGAYAARNRAIRAARGELFAFIDADCVARPDWLARLQHGLTAAPGTRVVMGRDVPTGASTAIALLGSYDHHKEAFALASDDPDVYYGHTNCMLVRRETFEDLGLFDPRPRGADVIFVQRVVRRYGTAAVRYEPDAVVKHLEVNSAPMYFRKAFIYGRSARAYRRVVPARPLSNRERLRVYREVVRRENLTPLRAAYLMLLLVTGVAAWFVGALPLWGPQAPASAPPTRSQEI